MWRFSSVPTSAGCRPRVSSTRSTRTSGRQWRRNRSVLSPGFRKPGLSELTPESWTSPFRGFLHVQAQQAFKQAVVEFYLRGNHGYGKVGTEFGIDHSTVRKWVAIYEAHGVAGLSKKFSSYDAEFKLSSSADVGGWAFLPPDGGVV
ncbi:helix-turn-helix domain-containing protein [Sinorhizobium medicae]|nr:helix-turn-helix domain-containing protein [Sinorhizobium medicae]